MYKLYIILNEWDNDIHFFLRNGIYRFGKEIAKRLMFVSSLLLVAGFPTQE